MKEEEKKKESGEIKSKKYAIKYGLNPSQSPPEPMQTIQFVSRIIQPPVLPPVYFVQQQPQLIAGPITKTEKTYQYITSENSGK
uniref:Uncharacterized protein n=2 Tax=Romanomermis culicivorax TaxID=13658 RepID=A0A915JD51_ROMCU